MYKPIHPIAKIEYSATIEDVAVKLSIDRVVSTKSELAGLTKHTHSYSELFVCLTGQLEIEIEEKHVTLQSGDALFIPSDISHHKVFEADASVWCAIGFEITPNRRRSVSKLSQRLSVWCGTEVLTVRGVPEFCADIYRIQTDILGPQDCVPAIELTLLLVKYAQGVNDVAGSAAMILPDSNMNRIALLENLVEAEFMTDITPHAVAEMLHISTRQLSRIVKKRFGTTFTRAVNNKRLETAAKLLSETAQTVESIADVVGFSSTAFMHHEFKRQYNMTPIEYRNSRRV